jgi:hypothetical protein
VVALRLRTARQQNPVEAYARLRHLCTKKKNPINNLYSRFLLEDGFAGSNCYGALAAEPPDFDVAFPINTNFKHNLSTKSILMVSLVFMT